MPDPSLRSRARGCLLGGALGDALGAPIEFWTHRQIVGRYGPDGPDALGVAYGVRGAITDDTQMTLWTADGCLRAYIRGAARGIVSIPAMGLESYLQWLKTQAGTPPTPEEARPGDWLFSHAALHARRAPGTTCLQALAAWRDRSHSEPAPTNRSKGCGGVMRMAPVGLIADDAAQAFRVGCDLAELTHGHWTGTIAAGAFAAAIRHLYDGAPVDAALDRAQEIAAATEGGGETAEALDRARQLAASGESDVDAIHALGTVTPDQGPGWVAEEALAVAALCARRYPTRVRRALRAAVTHTGDSDSTGSICGNLLGAALGEEALPGDWVEAVELRDVILQVADDLHDARTVAVDWYYGPKEPGWYSRYGRHLP